MAKKCKTCANKRRKRRSRSSKKGMFGLGAFPATQLLAMAAGAAAAKLSDPLFTKIPVTQIQENQKLRDAIKAGLGIALTFTKNEYLVNGGLGMAAYGIASLVGSLIPTGNGDGVAGIFGGIGPRSDYHLGTGPVFMEGLGPQPEYEVAGTEMWDGVGTAPDNIFGTDDIEVV